MWVGLNTVSMVCGRAVWSTFEPTAELHLLYARFICHVLHDLGYLAVKEPFQKLIAQVVNERCVHECE